MANIKIENLTFTYPGASQPALKSVSLDVREGELLLVIGRSGCGKSTLLRHLKTALTPHGSSEGSVLVNGTRLSDISEREQAERIGFVFQHPDDQIVTDKVWHELAFGLESLGMDAAGMRLRVAEMASYFGLENVFYKNVSELSGGQKQLLNLASVMALSPDLIVLDEPTSQLDPIAAFNFLTTVKKLNTELGITVILTEHRLEEALPFADKVAVMENGHVVEEGDVYEVFSNPQQPITKKFVNTSSGMGQINRLIRENSSVLDPDATLVQCTFSKESVGEALVSDVSRRFGVNVNIILGNVELLRGNPLGGLVVLIDGEEEKRRAVIEYLRAHDVRVEVIARG